MSILRILIILACIFIGSDQCKAVSLNKAPVAFQSLTNDLFDRGNEAIYQNQKPEIFRFFQRTEPVSLNQPVEKETSSELFYKFQKTDQILRLENPAFNYCKPFGMILIFPEHFFY